MGELVDDDVRAIFVIGGTVADVVPGEDDRTGAPRFPEPHVVFFILVGWAVESSARAVGVGIEEDAAELIVAAVAVVEQQQAGLGGDHDAHLIGDFL